MKGFLKFLGVLLSIFVTIAELVELLILPAIFILLGVLNGLPWEYYLITVGGYFALMITLELILNAIFKALDKKYSTRFSRKLERIISRFTKDQQNQTNLPTEDN